MPLMNFNGQLNRIISYSGPSPRFILNHDKGMIWDTINACYLMFHAPRDTKEAVCLVEYMNGLQASQELAHGVPPMFDLLDRRVIRHVGFRATSVGY